MITYTPQPGTIAARAVAAIRALPAGQAIANAVLADQLEQPEPIVYNSLEAPRKHGLVEKLKQGHLVLWRRGNGAPSEVASSDPDEADDDPIVQRIVPASAELPPPALAKKPPKVAAPRIARAGQVSANLRIALWSDGELVIQRRGETIVFAEAETRQLVHYLERMGEGSDA